MREWVELRSTMLVMDNRRFQCDFCLDKASDSERKLKGCEELSIAQVVRIKKIGLTRCPANFASQGMINWVEAHALFRQGVLPFPGSLMEQPNKVIEVFRVIDDYKADKAAAEAQRNRMPGVRRGR